MRRQLPVLCLLLLALASAGCGDAQTPAQAAARATPAAPRIVSLSPAITAALCDLGAGDLVVGRTQFCAVNAPVVGDYLNVNYEAINRIRPTHVLVQPAATGIDAGLQSNADEHGWTLRAWYPIDLRADVVKLVRELPDAIYDPGTPEHAAMSAKAAERLAQLASAYDAGPAAWQGRALIVDDVEKRSVYGTETYLNELLEAMGVENAASQCDKWCMLSLEDIVRLQPEAIVILRRPGAPGGDPMIAAGPLAQLDVPAVRGGRIGVLDHPRAHNPYGVVEVAVELRRIFAEFARLGATDG